MRLLRLWLLLLTVALALAAALVVLMPRLLGQELDRELDARLERTQHAAALLLRVNARKWIDTSAQVSSDAVLVESLDQATRGPADLQLVHKTVQDRLKYFNERMRVDLVIAVDAHGRVIARVGLDSTVYKDSIEGYPLVADALHGLRGDDTWSIAGKLFRVAASPVILRDHYVGAVVIGQEATAELAESMKGALGTDVVLLLRGRVIASTAALPILDRLPIAASSLAADLQRNARSAAMTVDGWGVVFGAFAGEASEHQASFALCAPRYSTATLPQRVLNTIARDPRALPWHILGPIGGAALGVLIIGFVMVSAFGSRPVKRLARQAQALARGEVTRLPDSAFGGELRTAVRAINTTMERIAGRVRAESRAHAVVPAPAAPAPAESNSASNLTPPPMPSVRNLQADTSAPIEAPSIPVASSPTSIEVLQAVGDFDDRKTHARAGWPPPAAGDRGLFSQSLTPLPPPVQHTDTEPHEVNSPPLIDVPLGAVNPLAAALMPATPARYSGALRSFDEPTSVESPSEALLIAAAHGTSDEIEDDFRRVFEEFVATRQRCGEPMDGVTLDKFVVKLRHNRSQLIQRYGCASVRFQVYVRDGKTALKATPVT